MKTAPAESINAEPTYPVTVALRVAGAHCYFCQPIISGVGDEEASGPVVRPAPS